ncbi:metallophosphoesterase family protein [Clostridium sardiniense]
MSKYVCSDLHGDYKSFIKMIETIGLKETDELYVLGDIFDRGENPIEILDYILSHKNIHLLKGNHEKMFEEYFESGDSSLWYCNGGYTTLAGLMRKGYDFEESLYKYIKRLPVIKVIDKFILVHAGLYLPQNYNDLELEELLELQEEDINIWTRDYIHSDKQYRDYKIICGHNIVQSIDQENDEVKMLHRKGHIFIDCGCCFKKLNGRLAVLRLDDMKEIYID